MNYRHLNTVLDYMAIDVITMYENNIKQHFCLYVERFVNVVLHKNDQIEAIKAGHGTTEQKKEQINSLCRELRILSLNEPKTSAAQYHAWIDTEKINIMPQRALREESVYYDIQCTPQDYLPLMLYMMKAVEERGCTIYNVFPLRSEITPKHFRLDTVPLVYLLFTNENGKRTHYTEKGALKEKQSDVWVFFLQDPHEMFS
jgi:hypothetical protein